MYECMTVKATIQSFHSTLLHSNTRQLVLKECSDWLQNNDPCDYSSE